LDSIPCFNIRFRIRRADGAPKNLWYPNWSGCARLAKMNHFARSRTNRRSISLHISRLKHADFRLIWYGSQKERWLVSNLSIGGHLVPWNRREKRNGRNGPASIPGANIVWSESICPSQVWWRCAELLWVKLVYHQT
jgi:hypothetical protein